jgi:hypothetical protein
MGELARLQRSGIENDFARIPHLGAVFENSPQLRPADVRAVFRAEFRAPGGDMRVQRLSGVFGGELDCHKVTVLKV